MIKKPIVTLIYNGYDVSSDFSKYTNSINYTEAEDNESDELTINLINSDGYFTDQWRPNKGDKLTASIKYGLDTFELGSFTVDEIAFNFQPTGDYVEIRALSTSFTKSVRTQKIKNYSGQTLKQIAQDVAQTHGLTLVGEIKDVKINNVVQKNETDLSFLKRIAKTYGYIFNIKDDLLTMMMIDSIESTTPLFSLSKSSDISSLSLVDSLNKVYGKCQVKYLDKSSKKIKTCTVTLANDSCDTLYIYKKCSSEEEAKQVANAALKGSKRELTGRISLSMPVSNFIAGVNGNIIGIGQLEGEFHVRTMRISVDNSGFKQSGEISRVGDIKNA